MNPFDVAKKINQMASAFEELSKTAPEIREAMRHLNVQAGKGLVDPKHVDALRRGLFTDRLTGGIMGNQAAYEDFENGLQNGANKGGVHVRMDLNDFKAVNSLHGYTEGDNAIRETGQHLRNVLDNTVGQSKSKLFRLGGDEFHAWVPDHESAARFARAVRGHMSSLAPFKGTHNWSMSFGFGHTPEHSDEALRFAKEAKKQAGRPAGQADFHAHSLVPGREGAIPVSAPLTRFQVA